MGRWGKVLKRKLRLGFGFFLVGLFFTLQMFSCPVVNKAILTACAGHVQNHFDAASRQPECESPCCAKKPTRDLDSTRHDDHAATHSCCQSGGTAAPLAVPVIPYHSENVFAPVAVAYVAAPTRDERESPSSLVSPPKPDTPLYLLRLQLLI